MSDTLITENFGSTWAKVERRLLEDLRGRGVPAHAALDISQEVAERAFARDVPYVDSGDLLRWALVVGRRLAIDQHRAQARVRVGEVPDRPTAYDLEDVVAGRLAIREVAAALRMLPDADRSLILDDHTAPSRQERVHLAVRRHRARQRLLAIVGSAMAWIAGLPIVRRLLRPAGVVVALVPLVATAMLLPRLETEHDHGVPRRSTASTTTTTVTAHVTADPAPAMTDRVPNEPAKRSRLAPLHGTDVAVPGDTDTHVIVRPRRESDRLFCLLDDPILGDVCTPI